MKRYCGLGQDDQPKRKMHVDFKKCLSAARILKQSGMYIDCDGLRGILNNPHWYYRSEIKRLISRLKSIYDRPIQSEGYEIRTVGNTLICTKSKVKGR